MNSGDFYYEGYYIKEGSYDDEQPLFSFCITKLISKCKWLN